MKNKMISMMSLAIILGLSLSGCSNKEKAKIKELEEQITKLEQQIDENDKETEEEVVPAESKADKKIEKVEATKTCIVCNHDVVVSKGDETCDGWACNECIDKVNNGTLFRCPNCISFCDPSDSYYDPTFYETVCYKCIECYECGNKGARPFQLTLEEDGINMKVFSCEKCKNEAIEARKHKSYCIQCGSDAGVRLVGECHYCEDCYAPVANEGCGYCGNSKDVFTHLDGWNVPVCRECVEAMCSVEDFD